MSEKGLKELEELKKPLEKEHERKLVDFQKECDEELRKAREAYNDMIVKAWENFRVKKVVADEELARERVKVTLEYIGLM
jgi:F0F1-type ATP synthase membrane subunit b/b'